MPAALTIRRAVAADAAALAELAERTFRDAFAADNTPADTDAHCARFYSPALQARELDDPVIVTLVAEDAAHALVAYAQLRTRGAPPDVVSDRHAMEIWRFYVDGRHHGRGLAQALMAAALEHARGQGARTVWLGVWERNPRALAFYRKCGFADVGTHDFWVGSDRQTDRVMVKQVR